MIKSSFDLRLIDMVVTTAIFLIGYFLGKKAGNKDE